ncbi:MAG: M48 family metallopeptidase [Methanosarcinales archaeon]|jgi:predicted metal-dependent hydrolase|nr:M48 family metallopeptidase [Methanosarcinales archaeon]
MPPVRPAAGEKIEAATFSAGSIQLNTVIIFSKKRKKTISYTVRYEAIENSSGEDSICSEKKPVLFVRAPASLSIKEIQSVLSENEENVMELLKKATAKEAAAEQKSKQTYQNGSIFHYMGRTYSLQLIYEENGASGKKIQVHLLDGRLLVHLPKNMIDLPDAEKEKKIKKAVESFYIEQADVFFNSRVDYFAEKYLDLIGKKPKSVKAASYKSKWGCCTYQNEIQLNWVLIQAETPVIDYVIIHELCHIRYKDHSKDFWNLVGMIDPKYKEKRQELKENGWILGMK